MQYIVRSYNLLPVLIFYLRHSLNILTPAQISSLSRYISGIRCLCFPRKIEKQLQQCKLKTLLSWTQSCLEICFEYKHGLFVIRKNLFSSDLFSSLASTYSYIIRKRTQLFLDFSKFPIEIIVKNIRNRGLSHMSRNH